MEFVHQLLNTSDEPSPVPIVEWSALAPLYSPTATQNELYREWYAWTECDYTNQVALAWYTEGHPDMGSTWLHTRTLALKRKSILDTMRHHDAASSRDSMRQTLVVASKDNLAIVDRSFPKPTPEDWCVALREAVEAMPVQDQKKGNSCRWRHLGELKLTCCEP